MRKYAGRPILTVLLILAVEFQACSHWVATDRSLDELVESEEELRVVTRDSEERQIVDFYASEDSLYGRMASSLRADLPPAEKEGEWVTIPRSEIQDVFVFSLNWGWIESRRSLDDLPSNERIRIRYSRGSEVEVTEWIVSQDSLQGRLTNPKASDPKSEVSTSVPLAIPRSEIQTILVRRPRSCFRGRPRPDCSSFWITEAGLSFPLSTTVSEPGETQLGMTFEVGYLWNTEKHSAWGGTVFFRGAESWDGVGVRPRYHRWLSRSAALDISPGVRFSSNGSNLAVDLSSQIGVSIYGIGAVLQAESGDVEVMNPDGTFRTEKEFGWFIGGRVGQYAGIVGIVGILGLAALIAATWD